MHPLYLRLSSFYFAYFLMLGAFAPFFGLYLKDLGFSSLEIGVLSGHRAGGANRAAHGVGLDRRPLRPTAAR